MTYLMTAILLIAVVRFACESSDELRETVARKFTWGGELVTTKLVRIIGGKDEDVVFYGFRSTIDKKEANELLEIMKTAFGELVVESAIELSLGLLSQVRTECLKKKRKPHIVALIKVCGAIIGAMSYVVCGMRVVPHVHTWCAHDVVVDGQTRNEANAALFLFIIATQFRDYESAVRALQTLREEAHATICGDK